MSSVREAALVALLAVLRLVPGVTVQRETVVPETVPPGGLLIVRDGVPGDPETTLSPLTYHYEHAAKLEVMVQGAGAGPRAIRLDALLVALGHVLAADRTLGGAVEWLDWAAPETEDLAIPAGAALKGATVTVVLFYSTRNPLW